MAQARQGVDEVAGEGGPSVGRAFRPGLRVQDAVDRLSREVTVVADAEGTLLHASPSVAAVFGYESDGGLPADVWRVLHPDDALSARAGLHAVISSGEPRAATLRVRAAAGDWRWVELVAVSLLDDAIGAVVCALHDITAEVEAKQSLRASEARFRAVADTSEEGICVVGPTGETLYENPRMAAILGKPLSRIPDVALTSTLPGTAAGSIAPHPEGSCGRRETAYAHPDGGERRLRVAATPLYADDGTPEGSVLVVSDVTDARPADRERRAGADLHGDLADDSLHLEYQPVVDLRSGALVGLEAQARWSHLARGDVPPTGSVTVAVAVTERTGLARRLNRSAVRHAMRDMAALRRAGVVPDDAYVAVNLSDCVADTVVVEDLVRWAEASGLPPDRLVLEITETAIMQDTESAIRLVRRLRNHGFRVTLDDFGTGYGSLAHLRDLRVSALKIDRSFVTDIGEQPASRATVATVVELARTAGAAVVAEGVETPIQAAILHRLGCVHAQGRLWSPAVPLTELLAGERDYGRTALRGVSRGRRPRAT